MITPRVTVMVPARATDADVLAEIHAASFPEPWTANDFAVFLMQPGIAGWISGARTPKGFILVRRVVEEAEVLTLAVDPAQRRQGLARRLLDYAMEELRQRGIISCFLEVAIDNTAARGLYGSAGFTEVSTRRGYYQNADGTRADAIVMRRDL